MGVGGSEAAIVQTDFTGASGYGGDGFQYQTTLASGNTSANDNDYTLSFDAEVNAANGGFYLDVQSFAGSTISGTASGEGTLASLVQLATPNVFQHFSYNLGQMLTNPYGVPNLPIATSQCWQIAFAIQNGIGPWGEPTTDAQVIIDNIQLTMVEPVPEPASLTFCAMGGLAAFAFLRRSKS